MERVRYVIQWVKVALVSLPARILCDGCVISIMFPILQQQIYL